MCNGRPKSCTTYLQRFSSRTKRERKPSGISWPWKTAVKTPQVGIVACTVFVRWQYDESVMVI